MVNFTTQQILLYINNEMSSEQTIAFENALLNDWTLQERLQVQLANQTTISNQLMQPSNRAVNNILAYAQQTTKAPLTV